VLDLEHVDGAVAGLVEEGEEFDNLLPQSEVGHPDFWARPVLAPKLDLELPTRLRDKDRLSVSDEQAFDPSEVDPLHVTDQLLSLRRERRLKVGHNAFLSTGKTSLWRETSAAVWPKKNAGCAIVAEGATPGVAKATFGVACRIFLLGVDDWLGFP